MRPTIENGLKTISLIRINKIATIDVELALGILDCLNVNEINQLNISLLNIFKLLETQ